MSQRYLQATYDEGRAVAAYLRLPREPGAKSVRVEKAGHGILTIRTLGSSWRATLA